MRRWWVTARENAGRAKKENYSPGRESAWLMVDAAEAEAEMAKLEAIIDRADKHSAALMRRIEELDLECESWAAGRPSELKPCVWRVNHGDECLDGQCGIKWVLPDGRTPAEHEMSYCPHCGRPLRYEEEP